MTPVTKYWVCKIAPALVAEAMECLGGNGYVEEAPLARIYREVPVNSIWEGSGNVMALDVLRVLQREPEAVADGDGRAGEAAADDPHLRRAHERIEGVAARAASCSMRAGARWSRRWPCWRPARSSRRTRRPAVADAFIATRFSGGPRQTYGQGLERADTRAILARASPTPQVGAVDVRIGTARQSQPLLRGY